jgi:hypothetical protein
VLHALSRIELIEEEASDIFVLAIMPSAGAYTPIFQNP